ncbi:archaeosortase/exosortase family protein [Congregicoccus parvus]|uniref:archaeosortase/exosortase family protein n=1 Tax=Congregicoccus parvus TaxID=3081749 RepID=UPI003FA58C37
METTLKPNSLLVRVPPLAHVAALALAYWPVWRWYVARTGDGSDEPLGLVALAAAICFAPRHGWLDPRCVPPLRLAAACVCTTLYLAVYDALPSLLRGVLAVCALACVLPHRGLQRDLPLFSLLLLSLPWMATLQYVLGFPLRAATAWCTAAVLSVCGISVEAHGTLLSWAGEQVLVDAPCSGIRMAWCTAVAASALGCVHGLPALRFLRLLHAAAGAVFAANVVRSLVLFLLETGHWPNPPWAHEATGLVCFGAALGSCVFIARVQAARASPLESMPPRSSASGRVALAVSALLFAVGGLAAVRPLADGHVSEVSLHAPTVVDWPSEFEGSLIERVRLHPLEERFGADFPGAFAAFTDGRRRIVFRRIDQATRKVHPAEGCLRAAGFAVRPAPARRDAESGLWAVVEAERGGHALRVREQIRSVDGSRWTDVSSWYWSALLRPDGGPWTAVTVIEPQ